MYILYSPQLSTNFFDYYNVVGVTAEKKMRTGVFRQ